jgi:hypothetical protein
MWWEQRPLTPVGTVAIDHPRAPMSEKMTFALAISDHNSRLKWFDERRTQAQRAVSHSRASYYSPRGQKQELTSRQAIDHQKLLYSIFDRYKESEFTTRVAGKSTEQLVNGPHIISNLEPPPPSFWDREQVRCRCFAVINGSNIIRSNSCLSRSVLLPSFPILSCIHVYFMCLSVYLDKFKCIYV